MRKENYHSDEFLSECTRPVDDVFRFVDGFKRFFANGFTVLLRIGVFRAGIHKNISYISNNFGAL